MFNMLYFWCFNKCVFYVNKNIMKEQASEQIKTIYWK